MERFFFSLFLCVVAQICNAQNTATANASATIVNPIGLTPTVEISSLHFSAINKKGVGKTRPSEPYRHAVEMATLKIVGSGEDLFSLSLAPASVELTDSYQSEPLLLQQFHLSAACNGQEEYSLQAMLLLPSPAKPGQYANTAPLDVTIHFN